MKNCKTSQGLHQFLSAQIDEARQLLEKDGTVPAKYVLVRDNGDLGAYPCDRHPSLIKPKLVDLAEYGHIDAVGLVVESWAAAKLPKDYVEGDIEASKEKIEVLVVSVENRTEQITKILLIKRDDDHKPFLGEELNGPENKAMSSLMGIIYNPELN